MKKTTKVFNQNIDDDVIAYRIVSEFKKCLEKDEWFETSTEKVKILAICQGNYDSKQIAIETIKQLGYSALLEDTYYGGSINAIKYFPNPKDKITHEFKNYCHFIYFKYTNNELMKPTEKDLKIISFINENLNGKKYDPFDDKMRNIWFNLDFDLLIEK